MIGAVVVGTGFGCYAHVRALQAAGFEVLALVGRSPEKTAERARLFGVPRAYGSLAEALSAVEAAAVTIATPPTSHAELALEAIAAGKHVLCEKPFVASTEEGLKVLAAAETAGVVHLLGTEFRYDAGQAILAQAVRDGLIGQPKMGTWIMNVPVLAEAAAVMPAWWTEEASKGGWLWAHGSQLIDQIRVTLGEVDGVSASVLHIVDRPGMTADDGFVAHFRCRNGAVGIVQSTAGDRSILVETRVAGSTGSAWIEGVGDKVKLSDGSGVRRLPVPEDLRGGAAPPQPEGSVTTAYEQMITFGVEYWPYVRLATAFRNLILADPVSGPPPATFVDGVQQMAVLEAMTASARQGGAWVKVARILS